MEELGNLMLRVCCKVGFEDGSWLGIIDLLTSSSSFLTSINLSNFFLLSLSSFRIIILHYFSLLVPHHSYTSTFTEFSFFLFIFA